MEFIKSIVYTDKESYDSETKDSSTLYVVNESNKISLYFRSLKLENVVYSDDLPEEFSPDCFYVIKDCLYYSFNNKTVVKLFDSKVTKIVKSEDKVEFTYSDGSKSLAVWTDSSNAIYPNEVRSQIVSQVGEVDLVPEWDKWGG